MVFVVALLRLCHILQFFAGYKLFTIHDYQKNSLIESGNADISLRGLHHFRHRYERFFFNLSLLYLLQIFQCLCIYGLYGAIQMLLLLLLLLLFTLSVS